MYEVGKRLGRHQKSSSFLQQLDLSFTFASGYHAIFRLVMARALVALAKAPPYWQWPKVGLAGLA
jgi:hypothetical protein